jgi:hypothetical protein
MNEKNNEDVVKEIIEYANGEIAKSKKKHLIILLSILASVALLASALLFAFKYEIPVSYSEDLIEVNIPVDTGLDIHVNLPNYKIAKAVLVKGDEDTYDLYINVSQTLVTKIFTDKDKSDNFVRAGNNIIVDYQSGLLMGSLPSGYNEESIMNIYYMDVFSAKNITQNNAVLVWTRAATVE